MVVKEELAEKFIEFIKNAIDGIEIDRFNVEEEIGCIVCEGDDCPVYKEYGIECEHVCDEYLDQFFKRYKVIMKVVPKEDSGSSEQKAKRFYCYGCPREKDCDYENCEYPERENEVRAERLLF